MNNFTGIYHNLRKIQPESARTLVRKILETNNGNVSATARILGISRLTVRRARNGTLKDRLRRPKTSPNKTSSLFEDLVKNEAKNTHYRHRRLHSYIKRKYGICMDGLTLLKNLGVRTYIYQSIYLISRYF